MNKNLKKTAILSSLLLFLYACGMGADARQFPPDAESRVKKNIEEGRGFRIFDDMKKGGSGNFDFASSNSLWRASLDTIDFMPLASANYSGGIIITDWYSSSTSSSEAIKISIRFLTNEIRSDAIDINVFYKKCDKDYKCVVQKNNKNIETELRREILKKAATYQKQTKAKNKSSYPGVKMGKD